MAVLARTPAVAIEQRLATLSDLPAYEDVRPPESGLVMLRGRIAGAGAPFNFGEASVSRAAVRLKTGEVGASYMLGRDAAKARSAALLDALWQHAAWRSCIERDVVSPLAEALDKADLRAATETAGTRVDFFTLVRGED